MTDNHAYGAGFQPEKRLWLRVPAGDVFAAPALKGDRGARPLHSTSLFVLAGLALLIAAGCTAPRAYHFEIAADMRGYTPPEHPGPDYFAGVCQAIRDLGPGAFILVPGDLDPPDRVRATLDAVLGADYPMYPVVGNHELDKPDYLPYVRASNRGGRSLPGVQRSGPPGAEETCYSFDYRDLHIAVINEYYDGQSDAGSDGDVTPELLEWLAADLAATNKPYVFVAGHEPYVSVPDMDSGRVRHRESSLNKYPEHNRAFWSLLREHHVVGYICGHTHNASLSKINGVWQIDAGHSRGKGDPGAPSTFLRVTVDPAGVRCTVYRRRDGEYEPAFEERLR